jgi:hypothetical protein
VYSVSHQLLGIRGQRIEKLRGGRISTCPKGSLKNKFAFSGVEALTWQGARRANSRSI